ncbi:MAG: hypothetical protein RBT80_06485 [Candidatus Vecturithrix sp.]|jgi:hypothetical protein|nr:hypothetical protein [Candidatus Vecturithrix sp.]
MKQPNYHQLIFQGAIALGQDLNEVKRKLSLCFHIDAAQLGRLFQGTPIVVKEDADYKNVLKYQILFEWAGAVCHIESKANESEPQHHAYVNVIFDGTVAEGHEVEEVKKNLKTLLKLNDKRLEELFSGHPMVIMQDVNYLPALKIQTSFELAGATCRIEPVKQAFSQHVIKTEPQQFQVVQASYEVMKCPQCGQKQKKSRKCRYCGVYIETYMKKNRGSKVRPKAQSALNHPSNVKRELLPWGIGLMGVGCLQFVGLGLWASIIVLVGALNLRMQQHVMFLVNGVTLLISGAAGSVGMILHALMMKQDFVAQAGSGGAEGFMEFAYIVIISGIQFYMGARAFHKFVSYRRV